MPINYNVRQADSGSNVKKPLPKTTQVKRPAYVPKTTQVASPVNTSMWNLNKLYQPKNLYQSTKPQYRPASGQLGNVGAEPAYGSTDWARQTYGANYYKPSYVKQAPMDRYDRMQLSDVFENMNSGFWGANPDLDFDDETKRALGMEVYNPNWMDDYYAYFGGGGGYNQDYVEYEPSWDGGGYGSAKPGYRGMNDVYWRI
jgi:hypothetical protein